MKSKRIILALIGVGVIVGGGWWMFSGRRASAPEAAVAAKRTRAGKEAMIRTRLAQAGQDNKALKLRLGLSGPDKSRPGGEFPLDEISPIQFFDKLANAKCACETKACIIEAEESLKKRLPRMTAETLSDPAVVAARRRASECQTKVTLAEPGMRHGGNRAALFVARQREQEDVAAAIALQEKTAPQDVAAQVTPTEATNEEPTEP